MNVRKKMEFDNLYKDLRVRYPIEWSEHADRILEDRYLMKDKDGKVIETKEELVWRVVKAISGGDSSKAEKYYEMIASARFLPNTPTLVNAGRPLGMMSACLVLPTGDSLEEWANTHSEHMICTKAGVGTGFDLSPIRGAGEHIASTGGLAAGAMGMLDLLNTSSQVVRQGSIRPSANMAIMRITHPEIMTFIKSKAGRMDVVRDDEGNIVYGDDGKPLEQKVFDKYQMFNISISAFDDEIHTLFYTDDDIELIDPHTKKVVGKVNAKEMREEIGKLVHDGGDPGLVNLTAANKDNPIVNMINPITLEVFGIKWATNPCGEQFLYVYSVCNLGSINLTKFVHNGKFDLEDFKVYVAWGIEFLDDVVTHNHFPLEEISIMSRYLRNVGLGVMGWADTLIALNIRYDSKDAIDFARLIMHTMKQTADLTTRELADRYGVAPVFKGKDIYKRNYETTCIAPTGTISMIAGCSSGIEPNFSFRTVKKTTIRDGGEFDMVNPQLLDYIRDIKNKDEIFNAINDNGGLINEKIAKLMGFESFDDCPFVTTFDVAPEWHIEHQAVFTKYVDNAVSKTINVPEETTPEQIIEMYRIAMEKGCKGITVYRNNSRSYQVLNTTPVEKKKKVEQPKTEVDKVKEWVESQKDEIKNDNPYWKKTEKVIVGDRERRVYNASPKIVIPEQSTTENKHGFNLSLTVDQCCDHPNYVYHEGCKTCASCGVSMCG